MGGSLRGSEQSLDFGRNSGFDQVKNRTRPLRASIVLLIRFYKGASGMPDCDSMRTTDVQVVINFHDALDFCTRNAHNLLKV